MTQGLLCEDVTVWVNEDVVVTTADMANNADTSTATKLHKVKLRRIIEGIDEIWV
jgi:hypothetical protein